MKIYLSIIGKPDSEKALEVPFTTNSGINMLITAHVLFFILYFAMRAVGLLDYPVLAGTIGDFVRDFLAIPGRTHTLHSGWISGIFIHQFVHFDPFELLLSTSVLWFFGHILQGLLGQRTVIMLYFVTVVLSATAFILSHYVFEIFSGHGTIMEGAFAGALGVMTTTVIFFRSHQVRVFGKIYFALWQIYAVVLLISLLFLFKPSMAYALVYVSSIWIGGQYAISRLSE